MTRGVLFACLITLQLLPVPVSAGDRGFTIDGWREAVVNVSSLDNYVAFFGEVAGWESRGGGAMDPDQLAMWGLSGRAAREQLMGNPGTTTGMVRLVEIAGSEQLIRPDSQSWDTGGWFDINMRVRDLQAKRLQLQRLGWQGSSDPVTFTFGPFEVTEWITRGPDGLTFALIQRHRPPLEGWPHLREFSRSFNATEVVVDLPASQRFYGDLLGFEEYLSHTGASSGSGRNVLGLPLNLAREVVRDVRVLHPRGLNEGSVELLAFQGLEGRDFSDRALPPNLGLLMLRFPVVGLDALVAHLEATGIALAAPVSTVQMPPYGEVRSFALRSPSGSWLEFFETQTAIAQVP